ncbi:MAG: GIY-YIG nuclease family protein, partial [Bacteroidaceae bacterium]|nr:GIY-YIG nuclease family protein [Bacteroidaceae bacterium]
MNNKTPIGFIYITTNLTNNKKYIGQKVYDFDGKWKTYLGSGVALTNAINKYGVENFHKEIIEECYSKEELDIREKYWIDF